MKIRDAVAGDAREMSRLLQELTAAGKRTSPDDADFVRAHYIGGEGKVRCSLAEDAGGLLGFQSLRRAAAGNVYDVAPGWGVIGTHIRPSAARRGVGRALFAVTLRAAEDAGLPSVDATIAADNPEALAYYEAMGFRTYRTPEGRVCKRFDLAARGA
ncbi:MAG: GNAT family N-acetyltransferase [Pseudomonadota bacterium]